MKKISTVAIEGIQIFKQNQLDDWFGSGRSNEPLLYLERSGRNNLGTRTAHDTERNRESFQQDSAESDRAGNRDAFTLGQPATDPVGARSDRGACAQCATDWREQPER